MTPDSSATLHDLDLLDDWLAGKGYGEEAGLVLRAMTLINSQAREIEKLRAALVEEAQCSEKENRRKRAYYHEVIAAEKVIAELRAENEKLRVALKPFIKWVDEYQIWENKTKINFIIKVGDLRAAAAALKETGDE